MYETTSFLNVKVKVSLRNKIQHCKWCSVPYQCEGKHNEFKNGLIWKGFGGGWFILKKGVDFFLFYLHLGTDLFISRTEILKLFFGLWNHTVGLCSAHFTIDKCDSVLLITLTGALKSQICLKAYISLVFHLNVENSLKEA